MQRMKIAFEKRIEKLNSTISEEHNNSMKKCIGKDKEIEELKRINEQLCRRLNVYSKYIKTNE